MSSSEHATRDNNFTQSQLRGIDLVVKSLSKKYPFVEGWKFEDGWDKWIVSIYIDIQVDWNKVFKFYNTKLSPKWEFYVNSEKSGVNSSLLLTFTELNPMTKDSKIHEEFFELNYNTTLELKNFANYLYENLPEEFSVFYSYVEKPNIKNKCKLQITNFYSI